MDQFKQYLQQHRDELDREEPGPKVWQRIRQETASPKKSNVVMMSVRWVAAACVILLAGIGVWHLVEDDKKPMTQPVAAVSRQPLTPATVVPPAEEPQQAAEQTTDTKKAVARIKRPSSDMASRIMIDPSEQTQKKADLVVLHNIENSFTQVINLQRERTSSIPMYAESPAYFADFKTQIKQIEKDEMVIKSDIAKRGVKGELLDQLINIYQQKLNVLKQLQIEMNKLNNRYKQSRGPVDSTQTYFLNI